MNIVLPQVTIQHDFQTVIAEVSEAVIPEDSFWVSCYKQEHSSVHGKVKVQRKQDGQVDLFSDSIDFQRGEHSIYFVTCPSLSIPPTRLRVPRKVFGDLSQQLHQVTAFDVAPNVTSYATGDGDGNIRVTSTSEINQFRASKPHLSTILSLRYFPSSEVILTASNDFTLSIISAKDLSVPRVLKGHTRAVTDSGIISRGKNVVSCSKDGTLRLWDVATGSRIRTLSSKDFSPIHKLSLGTRDLDPIIYRPPDGEVVETVPMDMDTREVETADKVVFCALQNGSFEAFDLSTKTSFFHLKNLSSPRSPLESMVYSSAYHMLATGSRAGVVTIYDTRQLATPLFSFQRNGASIEELHFVSAGENEVRLAVASTDGLPYVASVRPDGPQVAEELVGYDCDAVRSIKVTAGDIWTAGDDGLIRKY